MNNIKVRLIALACEREFDRIRSEMLKLPKEKERATALEYQMFVERYSEVLSTENEAALQDFHSDLCAFGDDLRGRVKGSKHIRLNGQGVESGFAALEHTGDSVHAREQIGSEQPPALASFILSLLLEERDHEIVLGDMTEAYKVRFRRDGKRKADFWYYRQVVLSVQPLLHNLIKKIRRTFMSKPFLLAIIIALMFLLISIFTYYSQIMISRIGANLT